MKCLGSQEELGDGELTEEVIMMFSYGCQDTSRVQLVWPFSRETTLPVSRSYTAKQHTFY